MPESRSRKKKAARPQTTPVPQKTGGGRWVVPVMVTALLLGLAWIVVFYLAGQEIPLMRDLGYWNLGIGMGLIMVGLLTAMKWE